MLELEGLSFEAFQGMIAEWLNVDPAQVTPQAYFITDLRVDSIRMADLLLRLEGLGVELDLEKAWEIKTVEDAYRYIKGPGEQHG